VGKFLGGEELRGAGFVFELPAGFFGPLPNSGQGGRRGGCNFLLGSHVGFPRLRPLYLKIKIRRTCRHLPEPNPPTAAPAPGPHPPPGAAAPGGTARCPARTGGTAAPKKTACWPSRSRGRRRPRRPPAGTRPAGACRGRRPPSPGRAVPAGASPAVS